MRPLFMADASISIQCLSGRAIEPYIHDLARLRIEVFRDFPYLYNGSLEYEERYLQTYLKTPDSIVVLASENGVVVGASTGLPVSDESEALQRTFAEQGYDPQRVFYCAESVLLKSHRGRGIYKHFFEGREGHARQLGRFDWCAFCGVQRPVDHPLRPADYAPLDPIWNKFGYVKHPEIHTTYHWTDVGDTVETGKPMVFWLKDIRA